MPDSPNLEKPPTGWERVKLGDICAQDKTTVLPNDPDAPALKYIGLEHVESGSGRILPSADVAKPVRSGAYRFDSRHVLYGKLRPYLNKVALPDFSGRCTTELVPLLPAKSVDRDWLAWYLRRPETVDFAMRGKTGSRMPRANMREFMGMQISLPPLAEQKRIVARLNAQMAVVDRAKAAAREILDAAEALNAAIIRELMPYLGHQLADFWKWGKLGEVCEIVLGQSPPSDTYRKSPEGLPFFQGKADFGEVNPKPTTWCVAPKKIAEPGDILISVRAPVGPTNVASERCCIGRGLAALRPMDGLDRDFLLAGLKFYEPQIADMSSGSTFKAITGRQLRETAFPIPPLDEQRRIVAILNERSAAAQKLQSAARGGLDEIEAMPSALLRRALGDGG